MPTDPLLSRLSALAGMMAREGHHDSAQAIAAIATEPLTFCDCGRTHREKQLTATQTTNHRSPMTATAIRRPRIITETVRRLKEIVAGIRAGKILGPKSLANKLQDIALTLDDYDARETKKDPSKRRKAKRAATRRAA